MEIEKVIEIFEKCIPYYQKACDEKWNMDKIWGNELQHGLCRFVLAKFKIIGFFNEIKYHYKNHMKSNYLFPCTIHLDDTQIIELCILPRLNFLKTEVKRLKRLQKQGYTHI